MGEAKRRRDRMTPAERLAEAATHKLADEGLLIKAGFVGFKAACFPNGCTDQQHRQLEMAFMSGALHVWSSIMTMLDPGEEATARDLARMDMIQAELEAFGKVLNERAAAGMKTEGNA